MRKYLFFLVAILAIMTSCNNEDVVDVIAPVNEVKEMSGTFKLSDLPQTIDFNGKQITFDIIDTTSIIQTKAAPDWKGPFYVSSEPFVAHKQQKVTLGPKAGFSTGVYICDVNMCMGKINLPSNAYAGKVGIPNPAGYNDYSHQTEGVNWGLSTVSGNVIQINWSFTTLLVKYDIIGRTYNVLIPVNGAKVKVPYYYMVE